MKRTAFAEEPGTSILALGGMPGKAYRAGGEELWAPIAPLYRAGEYAEAADRLRPAVEAHPQYAQPLYNLACCESLAGRPADAIAHLRAVLERSGEDAAELRELARTDTDLEAIRDLPEFKALVDG